MGFPAVTYTASSVSYVPFSNGAESDSASGLTDGLAAFLLRVAAYFQGCLASLPRAVSFYENSVSEHPDVQASLALIDPALEGGSEPLIKVRMNRALSRRMRWLIKRGRVQRSGRLQLCSAAAEARCNLTPGQFIEYNIRVNGLSRVLAYALNRTGRIQMKGGVLSLGMAGVCAALLSPD